MPVNPKSLLFGLILTCTLSGCGLVSSETPESWGASGGSYGAEQWVEVEKNKNWPSAESVALFCVTVAE
jgi:uncharacterized protein YceK